MRRRAGFTIIELVIAMMIMLVITGAAVSFLRRQTMLLASQAVTADALQNAQFSASQLERELREAGAGVADAQPMLVQIDSEALTFNANMVSVDTGDVRAVYQFRDADTNGTRAMYKGERIPLPNSTRFYPETTYQAAVGVPSGAETIAYYLRPDSTTSLPNRYMLLRRLNATVPTLVARNLVKDPRDTVPFFSYYTTDSLGRLVPIARNRLPMYHAIIHGASNDTGPSAITDSVRVVRLHFLAAARDPRTGKDALRAVETRVRLMNAGLLHFTSCGQPPGAASSISAVSSVAGATVKSVTLTWIKSGDDGAGEKDIERYAIFRRSSSATMFGDPISSLPVSTSSYSFVDTAVLPGQSYVYGIAAQDCTPSLSSVSSSAAVTVNP